VRGRGGVTLTGAPRGYVGPSPGRTPRATPKPRPRPPNEFTHSDYCDKLTEVSA
jgi:hypothetical protein